MNRRIYTVLLYEFTCLAFGLSGLVVCAAADKTRIHSGSPENPPQAEDDSEATEEVTWLENGRQQTMAGRVLVEAVDGGLLLQSDDGVLSIIEAGETKSRKRLDRAFAPVTPEKMAERLQAELPAGFRIHTTPHYVVCYNTSRIYAQWTSSLLERLYKAFTGYWKNQGLELREPEFPLPVLVFADRYAYEEASRTDLPGGVGNIVGFYSLRSNRVNMFDLSGVEAVRAANGRRGSLREINQMLSQPAAVPLVATIVHEATHQIAFNCGMQNRFADIPLWLCEGMAVYFEAPDLSSTRGWRGIGRINYPRLATFQDNLTGWQKGSLTRLLADSRRLRDPRTAADAYADAWALNYYLIKYEPAAYREYLKLMADKPPLVEDDAEARLAEFQKHFGAVRDVEQKFLKQMSRLK